MGQVFRCPPVQRDFDIFLQPGFWVALVLLTLMIAATVAVIAINCSYPIPS